jgi:hypothetical protein
MTAALGRQKRLKRLQEYLPRKPQTPADMLKVLHGIRAGGAQMTFRKVD